eukprot:symbB.v1.2.029646.t1/scaffold3219.1/size60888/5
MRPFGMCIWVGLFQATAQLAGSKAVASDLASIDLTAPNGKSNVLLRSNVQSDSGISVDSVQIQSGDFARETRGMESPSLTQASEKLQISEEAIPQDQGTWESKTKSPPSPSCPTCCRGTLKEVCPETENDQNDPCAGTDICSGFHRCFGAKRGFLQCQPKPDSEVLCQTGPNCLPECRGKKLGKNDDDCALQPIEKCEGYVWRKGRATQCTLKPGGNPSGADICTNAHVCGER